MYKLLLLFLAGGAGTLARYGTAAALRTWSERLTFPLGTLAVNLFGCLAIGLLSGLLLDRWPLREEHRLAIVVGFLGGFTTFSSYGYESTALLRDGHVGRAALNIVLSNLLGIAFVVAGYALTRGRA